MRTNDAVVQPCFICSQQPSWQGDNGPRSTVAAYPVACTTLTFSLAAKTSDADQGASCQS